MRFLVIGGNKDPQNDLKATLKRFGDPVDQHVPDDLWPARRGGPATSLVKRIRDGFYQAVVVDDYSISCFTYCADVLEQPFMYKDKEQVYFIANRHRMAALSWQPHIEQARGKDSGKFFIIPPHEMHDAFNIQSQVHNQTDVAFKPDEAGLSVSLGNTALNVMPYGKITVNGVEHDIAQEQAIMLAQLFAMKDVLVPRGILTASTYQDVIRSLGKLDKNVAAATETLESLGSDVELVGTPDGFKAHIKGEELEPERPHVG